MITADGAAGWLDGMWLESTAGDVVPASLVANLLLRGVSGESPGSAPVPVGAGVGFLWCRCRARAVPVADEATVQPGGVAALARPFSGRAPVVACPVKYSVSAQLLAAVPAPASASARRVSGTKAGGWL